MRQNDFIDKLTYFVAVCIYTVVCTSSVVLSYLYISSTKYKIIVTILVIMTYTFVLILYFDFQTFDFLNEIYVSDIKTIKSERIQQELYKLVDYYKLDSFDIIYWKQRKGIHIQIISNLIRHLVFKESIIRRNTEGKTIRGSSLSKVVYDDSFGLCMTLEDLLFLKADKIDIDENKDYLLKYSSEQAICLPLIIQDWSIEENV